ncbi:HPr family phosphocarrier protein [Microbacterium lacusdiani]
MIGLVIVSHSEPLARATVDLAMQMVHGDPPPVRLAAGAADGFGTDAVAIADAIDALADADGVVVLTDLGSAVISAEFALDLRSSTHPVRISDGPLVEGTTAALVRAAGGGTLDEVAAEADGALGAKRRGDAEPAGSEPDDGGDRASAEVTIRNPLGLHSRPAGTFARAAAGFASDIRVTDLTAGRGPANAASLVALLALGATGDHVVRIEATGPDAREAVQTLEDLIEQGFGELPAG